MHYAAQKHWFQPLRTLMPIPHLSTWHSSRKAIAETAEESKGRTPVTVYESAMMVT